MTVTLRTRLRSAVELLQRTLAVLGVAVDLFDVSGASRVATVFQVLALVLTLVLVFLFLAGQFVGRTLFASVFFVIQVLARQTLTVAAMFTGLGVFSLESLMDGHISTPYNKA